MEHAFTAIEFRDADRNCVRVELTEAEQTLVKFAIGEAEQANLLGKFHRAVFDVLYRRGAISLVMYQKLMDDWCVDEEFPMDTETLYISYDWVNCSEE